MKYVYQFTEGDASMRNLLGGKGANLCQMTKLGLPVPQGFTVSTDACNDYQKDGEISAVIKSQIQKGLKIVEKRTKKGLGNPKKPLILSVRSGARVSITMKLSRNTQSKPKTQNLRMTAIVALSKCTQMLFAKLTAVCLKKPLIILNKS